MEPARNVGTRPISALSGFQYQSVRPFNDGTGA